MPRLPAFLFAAAFFSAFPALCHAQESLRNAQNARRLSPQESTLFGPRAAGGNYDPRMIEAARIALRRAHPQTTWHCWRSVKDALLAANLVSSRPTTAWAKQAGEELCAKFGFRKLPLRDPRKAPVGAVIVYGGPDAGHVELRTSTGFVSDFASPTPYPRPLLGVFIKSA